jgi:hypothetical protein
MRDTAATGRAGDELLERSSQRELLGEILTSVNAGRGGTLVLVGGKAGVGTTAFVRRFCDEQEPPARVLWGACDARSPLARARRARPSPRSAPGDPATKSPIVAPQAAPSNGGFDVLSALIGAGIAVLLAMGAIALVRSRRHHVAPLGS